MPRQLLGELRQVVHSGYGGRTPTPDMANTAMPSDIKAVMRPNFMYDHQVQKRPSWDMLTKHLACTHAGAAKKKLVIVNI